MQAAQTLFKIKDIKLKRPTEKKNAQLPLTGEKYIHKVPNRVGYYVGIHRPKKTTRYFKTLEEAIRFRDEYYEMRKA